MLIIFLSYWTFKSLLVKGFFPMHDDTQPSRIYLMAKSLATGQFPVRWIGELGYGYGYPLFNFYAPLPYYLGALFFLSGLNILLSTKLVFFIAIVLSGLTMYLLAKEIVDTRTGILGAIIYLYAPYHAINIYIRGAVGEIYAYAFLPLVVLGIIKVTRNRDRQSLIRGLLIGAIGLALVLISHNISGLITLLFMIIILFCRFCYSLMKHLNFKVFCYLLLILLFGISISSFFTFPAFFEKQFTNVAGLTTGGSDFHDHFLYLDQLWSSPWGFAGSSVGRTDGMSFMIGKLHLILALFSIGIITSSVLTHKNPWKSSGYPLYLFCGSVVFTLFTIFLMLGNSVLIWENVPLLSYIQFPWRFLNFTLLGITLATVTSMLFIPKKWQNMAVIFFVLILIAFNSKYFYPQAPIPFNESFYTENNNLNYQISKTSDEYLPSNFLSPKSNDELKALKSLSSSDFVKKISDKITFKEYAVETEKKINYISDTAYFPGWHAYTGETNLEVSNFQGIIAVNLPPGKYDFQLKLENTPIRSISNLISILSLFLLVYITLLPRKPYEK